MQVEILLLATSDFPTDLTTDFPTDFTTDFTTGFTTGGSLTLLLQLMAASTMDVYASRSLSIPTVASLQVLVFFFKGAFIEP